MFDTTSDNETEAPEPTNNYSQFICSQNIIKLYHDEQLEQELELFVYPLSLPNNLSSKTAEIAVLLKTNEATKTFLATKNKSSILVTLDNNKNLSFIVKGQWNQDGRFVVFIYLNTTISSYRMEKKTINIQPQILDEELYREQFLYDYKINDNVSVHFKIYPIQQITDNNTPIANKPITNQPITNQLITNIPIIIFCEFNNQKILHATTLENSSATFDLDIKKICIAGKWNKNIFVKDIQIL